MSNPRMENLDADDIRCQATIRPQPVDRRRMSVLVQLRQVATYPKADLDTEEKGGWPRWPSLWASLVVGGFVAAATEVVAETGSVAYIIGLGLVAGSCHRLIHMLVNEIADLLRERQAHQRPAAATSDGIARSGHHVS